jgi:hypothetical protein
MFNREPPERKVLRRRLLRRRLLYFPIPPIPLTIPSPKPSGRDLFLDQAAYLTKGRIDHINNFQHANGANGTLIDVPHILSASTNFVASNGGTMIEMPASASSSGMSEIFVSGVAPTVVQAQTFFIL